MDGQVNTVSRMAVGDAGYDFVREMPLPIIIIDRERGLYLANRALAQALGYERPEEVEDLARQTKLLANHFRPEVVAQLYELLHRQDGLLEGWLVRGQDRQGRELTFEVTARARLRGVQGPADFLEAFFVPPGNVRDAKAFLQNAKQEAELANRAKNEFLSNISHELRTPLNTVIGMLDLSLDDESVGSETRHNLGLAKEAADTLFGILNDLITLSNLEARRLVSDVAQFSPNLLLRSLARQFAAKAQAQGVCLTAETPVSGDLVLVGGYNLIVLAMEKLVDNAIKFVGPDGRVDLTAGVLPRGDGPWLECRVRDTGPGLDPSFLEMRELFRQGDGSMSRRHGGLGLGLRLVDSIVSALGGHLNLRNAPQGGADLSFKVPVDYSHLE